MTDHIPDAGKIESTRTDTSLPSLLRAQIALRAGRIVFNSISVKVNDSGKDTSND